MRAKYMSNEPERQPEEISDLLGEVLERVSTGADTRHGAIVEQWSEFAPGDWGRGAPIGVKDGVLLVAVPDGATASLVKYQTAALIAAIDGRFGAGVVTGARAVVTHGRDRRNPL
jgi:hypothetical protein